MVIVCVFALRGGGVTAATGVCPRFVAVSVQRVRFGSSLAGRPQKSQPGISPCGVCLSPRAVARCRQRRP
eukprot:11223999-Lingulodinium_polyedra.AAC.1